MKLRVRGNSIRLRLTKSEIATLLAGGRVEDAVSFGRGVRLGYVLASDPVASAIGARFEGGVVTVSLPKRTAEAWASSDAVGLEAEQALDGDAGVALRILVEKDFACLTPRKGEDDTDAFANPNETC